RVRMMITLAIPHPASLFPTPRLLWGVRHFFILQRKNAEELVRRNDFAHVDELVHRWSPAWKFGPEETAAVKDAFRQPGCLEAALGYYRAITLRPPEVITRKISVPSVVFGGADDGILKRKHFEKGKSWFTNSYELVYMPGGHFLHREHPARFNEE